MGEIDDVTTAETVELALTSLSLTGADYVLALSDVRFSEGLLDEFASGAESREYLSDILSKKRAGELNAAENLKISEDGVKAFKAVISLPSGALKALDIAERYAYGSEARQAIKQLRAIVNAFKGTRFEDKLQIDFSMTGNTRYYNGVLFSGYVLGAAGAVLKGGRYDKLLDSFAKGKGAVGFALYTGELENLGAGGEDGADAAVIYKSGTDAGALFKAASKLRQTGISAVVVPENAYNGGALRTFRFDSGELTEEK